jgi:hypothetical protein
MSDRVIDDCFKFLEAVAMSSTNTVNFWELSEAFQLFVSNDATDWRAINGEYQRFAPFDHLVVKMQRTFLNQQAEIDAGIALVALAGKRVPIPCYIKMVKIVEKNELDRVKSYGGR